MHKVMKIPWRRDASDSEHGTAGKTRLMTEPSTSHEAPIPSPSKIIGGKSIGTLNYIVTNFMVHPCLKNEQAAATTVNSWISGTSWGATGWPEAFADILVLWPRSSLDWPEFLSLFITAAWKCISWFVFNKPLCDYKSNMFSLLKKLDLMCIGSSHCTS